LISIQIFGAVVYSQAGATSRLHFSIPYQALYLTSVFSSSTLYIRYHSSVSFVRTTGDLYEVDRTFSQVEYMILALFLKRSGLEALVVAYVVGTILFGIPLFVPDCKLKYLKHTKWIILTVCLVSVVYILTVISGATDFAMPLFLLYGRQWLFATAALAHGVQVVAVFIIVIKDFGLFWWNFLTFWGTWM
jgi:hypothetical protein